ncbi:MAG: LPS export ABC transporter periplasmic protein LptC [Desulfobacterota bacterium]|jgi:LPS export ABC transporter protein LptC|nr:LPS export ABC transporter periplasmic protein LptC [Thermodesulfobacteriota bacterium]
MQKIFRKHWPLVAMGFLIALVTVFLFQARKPPVQQAAPQEKETEEGIRLKDIHYVQDDPSRKVTWALDASEARLSKDQQVVTFMDFHLTLEPENKPRVTVQGKQGEFDKRTGRLELQGDLIGETENGLRFATEQAVYNHKQGSLETDKDVKISGPLFSIEGKGLFLDVGKEKMQILNNATTLIYGEPPTL